MVTVNAAFVGKPAVVVIVTVGGVASSEGVPPSGVPPVGVPVLGTEGGPSAAFSLVATTCTVYSTPGDSDRIVYSVVLPPAITALKSRVAAVHCTR